jgi:hypothetical protein
MYVILLIVRKWQAEHTRKQVNEMTQYTMTYTYNGKPETRSNFWAQDLADATEQAEAWLRVTGDLLGGTFVLVSVEAA